jgi:radical SAM protein with 4Fe4S-binding SPASM domain
MTLTRRLLNLRRHAQIILGHATPRRLANLALNEVERRRRVTRLRSLPYVITVEPTNACNLRCPLCPTGLNRKGRRTGCMDLALFREVLRQVSPYAFRIWLYNWGEPSLHEGIFEMIAEVRRQRLASVLSSNLTVLKNDTPEELVRSGLEWLVMSVDGLDQASYARYRRGGDFEVVRANISRLVEARRRLGSATPVLEWQFLVMRHNQHLLPAARSLAHELGVDIFNPMPTMLAESPFTGKFDREQAEQWLPGDAAPTPEDYARPPLVDRVCPWPWYTLTVNWDGGVSPCCRVVGEEWDLGNVREQTIAEIWRGERYVRLREIVATQRLAEGFEDVICSFCREFRHPT